MKCVVYKGVKSPDRYLFVREDIAFSDMPETLLDLMGELQVVISLDIGINTKLAQASAATVMSSLKKQGFYLQLPKQKKNKLGSESMGAEYAR